MKAQFTLALANIPTIVRLSLVVVSLLAMALGSGAPDDWGVGSSW